MPTFAFTTIDPAGIERRGSRGAPTSGALTAELEAEGLFVLEIVEGSSIPSTPAFGAAWRYRADVLEITRTLAALLPAGLPLARALETAARLRPGITADALSDVRARIERGDALAESLALYPALFPPHYTGLVRAGERSGDLGQSFARLTTQLERDAHLRSRLTSAALYPVLLALAGGGAILVLLLVVLPNFAELLQRSGARLPASTAFVLGASHIVRRFWYVIPLVIGGSLLVFANLRRTLSGRLMIAEFLDGLPLIRTLRRESGAARFARLTGTLLEGGAPLLAALHDATVSLDDALARAAAERVSIAVRDGASLSSALAAEPVMPAVLAQLVAVGEESGQLGNFLLKAAQLFEDRTERSLQRLVALAEPAMIVLFGLIVGMIALSLLQAIYGVNAGSFR